MKPKILHAIAAVIIFSSCSSAYKSTQTPDDLYYSPVREVVSNEESQVKKKEDKKIIREEDDYVSVDDRFIQMKIRNRRFASIDDLEYWYDSRYSYNCNCTCNTITWTYFDGKYYPVRNYGYNRYSTMNNPYLPVGYYTWNPKYPVSQYNYYKPEPYRSPGLANKTGISAYKNNSYDNRNLPTNNKGGSAESNAGSLLKRVFTTSGSTVDRATRTFESNTSSNSSNNRSTSTVPPPATTTSSNAGGSSGGYNSTGTSTSTSRPPRGNN